jgi:hypothetical protein
LVELAHRGVAEVIEAPGVGYAIRLKSDMPGLSRLEQSAVAALRAPSAEPHTLSLRRAFPWYRRWAFSNEVMNEAVQRGLAVRQRVILPGRLTQMAALAAGFGLWMYGFSVDHAFYVAAAGVLAFWAPFVVLSLRRRGVLTNRGSEAASQWLGVRKYLANDPQLRHAPPTAVVMWGPYLSYAVALGATELHFEIAAPRSSTGVAPVPDNGGHP